MGFILKKEIALDKFGWAGCSLTMNSITYAELAKWQAKLGDAQNDVKTAMEIIDLLTDKFIAGTAIDDSGKKVELKKEDIENLPFDIVLEAAGQLAGGQQDPN